MKAHRPVVMGDRGMIATGHPLASDAALDVLKTGGNAFDAALCASAVLSVVKSYHCGLGGDLFGMFYLASEGKMLALNGSGRAPKEIRRDLFGNGIPHRGILAASTPGNFDGWLQMAERLASRSFTELIEPAIHYAEKGFPVFPHLRDVIRSSEKMLGGDPAWSKIFLQHGRLPELGDILVQEDLARTLRALARGGREAFYGGNVAAAIVQVSKRLGGCFSLEDFSGHRSRWENPISSVYRGNEICVPPPNSFGLLLLLQLVQLAHHNISACEPNSPECIALQVKAHEQGWRAGQFWIADPEERARQNLEDFLRAFPAAGGASESVPETNRQSSTTYIAAADRFGNWASLIQSVHQSFGCGVVVDGTGIVLNNRMSGFNLIAGHPNELGPGKLPAHTLTPALIMREQKPVAVIGTPGGLGQTQFLTQVFCNLFDFRMNLQEAIEAPRWQSEKPNQVELESRLAPAVAERLLSEGYDVKTRGPWEFAFGGVEAVFRHSNGRVFLGAADPRREGYAIGY
jgi:gamma-glutamyltranspeptidase/glutathione hydrolase